MIADAVLVLVGNAGERMLHHGFPGDFTEDLVQGGAREAWVFLELSLESIGFTISKYMILPETCRLPVHRTQWRKGDRRPRKEIGEK